jgi:hypothetical protein
MIAIAGVVLAALGVLAAVVLVAAPMGWVAATPGLSLWVLFPLFTLIGYTLLVLGSRDPAVKAPTRLISVPLLSVALLAAVVLVAAGAGLVQPAGLGQTASLWYVLVLGGVLGAIGTLVSGRKASD